VKATADPPLDASFFDRPPRRVASELIGCKLLHGGVGGRIVEAEAYERGDPACHAFGGLTARNAPLFGPPGRAYVYLCYGIHSMFNVVADAEGVAAAVLIRALEPTDGLDQMRLRRAPGRDDDRELCSGPGKLCQALAIELSDSGSSAVHEPYALLGRAPGGSRPAVTAGPRIGLTKAAELPWRYCLSGSRYLSRPAG
jgi:DNA-3-methyladenine glycosylase